MKILTKTWLLITLFVALSNAQTITQQAFLDQLKQTHPLFVKERLAAQIEKEEQSSYLGTKDWHIFSSLAVSRETPEIAIAGPERTDALSLEGGVEKLFWNTGSRLSASVYTSSSKIKIDPILSKMWRIPQSFYQNKIALTYIHPLLKNRKGFLDRLQYELKQFDIDFSEVQSMENQEEFLSNAAKKFIDWILLSEQVKIVTERFKLSKEELARAKRKRAANLVDAVDVIRAEDAVRIANQNRVSVEVQYKALRSELAVLTKNEQLNNSRPVFDLYTMGDLSSLDQSIEKLKKNSRLLRTIKIRLNQLDMVQKGFKENMKPDLSMFAQMNTKNLDKNIGESFGMDKYDIIVGLQFRMPLEKRMAESQINKTDLQSRQIKAWHEGLELALTSALTNLHIQIEEMKDILKLNREQIESAENKTIEEFKLYNQGRGSLTFVIQSRDSEENAKLLYALNAATYHRLIIQFRALTDEFLIE